MRASRKYFLRSERLGFRPWTEDDLDLALGLWGDPQVTRWIDSRGRFSEQRVRERLLQEISMERQHGVQYWPVFLLETKAHVGCCGLRPYGEERGILEIGVHIRLDCWGRGYATEATRAVIAYAFNVLGAKALFAGHNPKNTASRALLKKLGFTYTHDELYEPTGLNHPSYLLTAEDYKSSQLVAG
jgi:ribosomal-protein-alanine N-acetyltransferase